MLETATRSNTHVCIYTRNICGDLESGCSWKHACQDRGDGSLRRAASRETLVEAPSDADVPTFQSTPPLVDPLVSFIFSSSLLLLLCVVFCIVFCVVFLCCVSVLCFCVVFLWCVLWLCVVGVCCGVVVCVCVCWERGGRGSVYASTTSPCVRL